MVRVTGYEFRPLSTEGDAEGQDCSSVIETQVTTHFGSRQTLIQDTGIPVREADAQTILSVLSSAKRAEVQGRTFVSAQARRPDKLEDGDFCGGS